MIYTVKQLSKLAQVSSRTLHFYDQMGLLKPSFLQKNGYRCYEEKELIRLQQILFFRELEFSLEHIKTILDSPGFNLLEALKDQQHLLELKRARLDNLLTTLHNTLKNMKKDQKIQATELYGSFTKKQMEEYKQEVRQKYGNELADQTEQRTKNWKPEDYARIEKEREVLLLTMIEHMKKGFESKEVQDLVAQYHQGMYQFYDCNDEIFRGLGKLYVEDQRFTDYFLKYHQDLPVFLSKAIAYYSDHHQ